MKKNFNRLPQLIMIISLFASTACSVQTPGKSMSKNETSKWFKSNEWLNGCKLKPDQSINQEAFAKEYFGNKALWDKTFVWLKENDLNTLAPGRYVIEEGNSTATISKVAAPEIDKVKWESHRNFNDIQYIVKGKASMGISPIAESKVTTAYDSNKDIAFYEAEGKFDVGEPGTFFIYTPSDVHRPGIKIAGNDTITKLVVKVRAVKQN